MRNHLLFRSRYLLRVLSAIFRVLSLILSSFAQLLLGRISASTHRIGSFYFVRWWFVDRLVVYITPLVLDNFRGTPFLNLFFKLLGADISMTAYINTADITGYDLVKVGANCIVLRGAGLHGHSLGALFLPYRSLVLPYIVMCYWVFRKKEKKGIVHGCDWEIWFII